MAEAEEVNLPKGKAEEEKGHLKRRRPRRSIAEGEGNRAQGQSREESTKDTRGPEVLTPHLPLQAEDTRPKTEREETEAVQAQKRTTEEEGSM